MARLVLRLLGGFQAERESGEPVEVPGRKAQALLAFLALPPGVAHPRDTLAALLWPEMAAAQARANLRLNLFALRRALAFADPLRLERDTVALDAPSVDVDAVSFEHAVTRGELDDLAAALATYRGDLLAGLRMQEPSFEEWLLAQRERLRECALDGLARLLAHRQQTGDLEAAAQAALRLLAMDPLQEPVHRALIRLYASLGRRGDALRQYHVCVNVLRSELNVDPEVETRELYQEILRTRVAEPSGDPARARGAYDRSGDIRWRPVEEVPFVGRTRELAALDDALRAAWSAEPRGVVLIGDPGIGKSRLVGELVKLVLERGGRVAVGHGYETEQVLPFRPWIDVLRSDPIARDRPLVTDLPPRHRAARSHLLPEVEAPSGGSDERLDFLRLFEAITSVVRASAAHAPLLVVLEDLHWADEMSLRLLPYLCRHLRNDSALVAVTVRDAPDAQPRVLRMLDELRRDWPMTLLPVPPLSREETTALAGHVAPRRSALAGLDDRVWEASRGNPFIIVETLRALADSDSQDSSALPVAAGVRELIARRLDRLGDSARRVIAAAAVIGQEFDFSLLPPVAGIDEEQAAEGVEDLVRHRLLREVGSRFELVHDRIRRIVYDDILAPRRALLHRRAAQALEALHADDLAPHVTALAIHYRAAGAWREAATYWDRAGLAAAKHSAHHDAASSCEQALAALARLPETPETRARACDLEFRLGYSLSLSGRFEDALRHYEASAGLARALADDRRLWLAQSARSSPLTSLGRYTEGREIATPTLAGARAIGDARAEFWISIQLSRIEHALGDYRAAVEHARAAEACLRGAPSIEGVGADYPPALAWRAWLVMNQAMLGEFVEAAPDGDELEALLRDPSSGLHARLVASASLGVFACARGDLERARSMLETAVALGRQSATTSMLPRIASCLASVSVLSGRVDDATALLEGVVDRTRSVNHSYLFEEVQCRLAEAYLAMGRLGDAEHLLGEALGRARESRARGAEAEILRALGELEGMSSTPDLEAAVAHGLAAIAIADELGMRPLHARCRFDLAVLRRRQGQMQEARTLVADAAAEFREMGMTFWRSRAEVVLASLA